MTTPTVDRDLIVRTIETWPNEDQVTLAQHILQRAAVQRVMPQLPSWRLMAGIASAGKIPPSDEIMAV